MKIVTSYKCKILNYNKIFRDTVDIYREAVSFFVELIDKEWVLLYPYIRDNESMQPAVIPVEKLSLETKKRPVVKYPFNDKFYKFPCYLRRSAVMDALSIVNLYKINYKLWIDNGMKGNPPRLVLKHDIMPAFYKGNMFEMISDNEVKIKIYHQKDWVWLNIKLRKQDVNYIKKYCDNMKMFNPVIERKSNKYYLRFAFEYNKKLNNTSLENKKILAVDLGINNFAVMCVMDSKGTVTARKFVSLPKEKDLLNHSLNKLRKMQRENGSCNSKKLWSYINRYNDDISSKIANEIADYAVIYSCDVIVFEHLNIQGKIKGKAAQKIKLWRKKKIQDMVTTKAHKEGIRISRVNPANTSKLAFDGSGEVLRNTENYSLCTFSSGKQYSADLNASYNIGARYFIREYQKTISAKKWSLVEAKVPSLKKRTTCTLSTLISFCVENNNLPVTI